MRTILFLLSTLALLAGCQSDPDPRAVRLRLLADTQQRSNDRMLREAEGEVKHLQRSVALNREQPRDIAVLQQAQAILAKTKALSDRLRRMSEAVREAAGSANEARGLASEEAVRKVLMPAGAALSVDRLAGQLRAYAAYMQQLVPGMVPPGCIPSEAARESSTGSGPASPSEYRRFYFEGTTAAEALAVLAQQEASVLQTGLEGLSMQSQRIGAISIVFDRFGAFAIPRSNTVRVGQRYSADLLLVSSGSGPNLRMTANGRPVPVGPDAWGRVEFIVPGQALRAGQQSAPAYWEGTISVRHYGQDTTLRVRVPYTVVR